MKNLKFLLALAFFLITFTTSVTAQPYPITTTTQLSTPQLPQLESLADPTNNTVFLSLVLNDITQPTYNLRLRLIISGNGINIETDAQAFVPSPINLQYNVPVLLNGGDLSAYFKLDNLRFSGMTKAEYLRLGTLPEGLYSVCFEAYDYNRFLEPPVSNRSCATSNLEVHDPPVILNPIGEYPFTTPQQLQFNWQNRHIGAFPVEYELRIYEKRPGLTDDQILVSMPPLFRVTTRLPTYSYGPTDPLLREAQAYLTVVQIRDLTDNNYFKNLGNSKPETFILKTPCRPGLACSDNDDCTLNDTYDKECNCIGTPFYDPNGDGLADPVTIPAPTIVKPDKEICVNDGKSVIAWTPNHDLNIEVQYELSIWLDKVEVTQTPEYLEYQQYLQASLEKFLASQKYEYEIFIKEQQTQKEEWTKELEATEAKCQEEIRQIYDKFAQGQQTSLEEFRAYLKDFSDKCEADKQAAIEAFRKELKKEIIEFEENQKANKAEIATTLKNQEAEFLANQQQAATDFEAKQTTDLKNFLAQQEKSAAENQAQFEQDMAAIQDAKVAAEVEYQTCLEEADNFRNTARLDYLEAIAPIQQEIGLVNLVLQNLKTNFVNTRLELRNQYRADLRNARTRADRRRIQVAYRAAVRAGRDEFRADFAEEKAEKEPLRAQIAELRAALKAALSNAKATIEEMKTVCEQEYAAELKDLADKETSLINALANSEVQAVSDYEAFLEAQAAEAAEFVKNQENEAAEFQEQLAETVAAFAEEQAAAYAEFKQKLAEREKVFYEKLSDCKALIAEEAAFFEARQKEEKAAFGAKIKEKAAYCSIYTKEQLNKLAEVQKKQQAEFLAQQAEQLAAVKDKLAAQFAAYVKELEAQYSKGLPKLVYTNKLDSLYQHLLPTDYPLMPGYTYTTQVQATVPCSRVTIENDGLSEMQTFVISGDAPIVEPTPPTKAPTTSTYPSRGMLGSASSGISVYHPYIAPPQSLIATVLTTSSFQANWSPMKSAEYYILEVATDDNFNNLLPAYSGIVLSNTATSYMIENIEGEDFYYRVRSGNSCSLTEFSGIITVSVSTAPACIVGADCDDGLPCTINDKIGKDCKCYGRHTGDEDGDTVCDAMDICPGHNDLEDTDGDGVPDACDECNGECDDGYINTINDMLVQNPEVALGEPPAPGQESCICQGTPINELDCTIEIDGIGSSISILSPDSDGDTVCDKYDVCPGENDLEDENQNGIPDCTEVEEIECPEDVSLLFHYIVPCEYCADIVLDDKDCQSFITGIQLKLSHETPSILLDSGNNSEGFSFPYCTGFTDINNDSDETYLDCTGEGLAGFVNDLQNWLSNTAGHEATIEILDGSNSCTRGESGIRIANTTVEFEWLIISGCQETMPPQTSGFRLFKKGVCGSSEGGTLVAEVAGDCENPTFSWTNSNTGAVTFTTSEIAVNNPAAYILTVTCADGCEYTSTDDLSCMVGGPCDDTNPCTVNDVVIDANCTCIGTYLDSDGDGLCDGKDDCSDSPIRHEPPLISSLIGENAWRADAAYPFAWLPMHEGDFEAIYTLRIYEAVPGVAPQITLAQDDNLEESTAIFSTITTNLEYIYSATDAVLEIGKKYIIEVQATHPTGEECFDNEGKSDFVTFELNDQLVVLSGVIATSDYAKTCMSIPVQGVKVTLTSNSGTIETYTDEMGRYTFPNVLKGADYTITASKEVHTIQETLCGISAEDIIKGRGLILHNEYAISPYQLLAGDFNGSWNLSTLDLVYLNRLEQNFFALCDFPTPLWRFFDENDELTFASPTGVTYNEDAFDISLSTVTESQFELNFIGVKQGDVTCDIDENCIYPSPCNFPDGIADIDGDGSLEYCDCPDCDGDGTCDDEDICAGYNDSDDIDGDGIPDMCDDLLCTNAEGDELTPCEAIGAFYGCTNIAVNDMAEVSLLFAQLADTGNIGLADGTADVELEGDADQFDIQQTDGDFSDLFEPGNLLFGTEALLIKADGSMADHDEDGVADLFDRCPCGKDNIDVEGFNSDGVFVHEGTPDGIPDDCQDAQGNCIELICPTVEGEYDEYPQINIRWDLIIYFMFNRACVVDDPCYSEGAYNCACDCVPVGDMIDTDGDGVCDADDLCHGSPDLIEDENGEMVLNDSDDDGIPNGCDPTPCPATIACPPADASCVIFAQINPETCECEMMYDADDDDDGVCNQDDLCPGSPDLIEDEDGEMVLNDSDDDGIINGCDICPLEPFNLGDTCDDGIECTTGDVVRYTFETQLLSTFMGADFGTLNIDPVSGLHLDPDTNEPTSIDIGEVALITGKSNIENIYLQEEMDDEYNLTGEKNYYILLITGCDCAGVEFDEDYDGVCDAYDICPGFPDPIFEENGEQVFVTLDELESGNNSLVPTNIGAFADFDNDYIPDGCDPPLYDIPCPIEARFLTGFYGGIILVFDGQDFDINGFPDPVSFEYFNSSYTTTVHENVRLTNVNLIAGTDRTEVLYEIPELDQDDLHSPQGEPLYIGNARFSEGQSCFNTETAAQLYSRSFSCPDDFDVINDALGLGFSNPFALIFDLNTIPSSAVVTDLEMVINVELKTVVSTEIFGIPNPPNESFPNVEYPIQEPGDISFQIIGQDYSPGPYTLLGNKSFFTTDYSFAQFIQDVKDEHESTTIAENSNIVITTVTTVNDISITSVSGNFEFDTGLSCSYSDEGLVYPGTNPTTGTSCYIGQPCPDPNGDGDEHTFYDVVIDLDCNCAGTLVHDADNDGIHDDLDQCPGGDDAIDNIPPGGNGIPDYCDCPSPAVATRDYGDGIEVEQISIKNINDLEIVLKTNDELDPEALQGPQNDHVSYTVTWTPELNGHEEPNGSDLQPLLVDGNTILINNLAGGTDITVTIVATCASGYDAAPLEITTIIMADEPDMVCIPYMPTPPVCPAGFQQVENLYIGDQINAAGFNLLVTDVTGLNSNGSFNGSAMVTLNSFVPVPGAAPIPVNFMFENLVIEVCDGEYIVKSGDIFVEQDPNANLDAIFNAFIGDFELGGGNALDNLQAALIVLQGKVEDMTSTQDYYNDVHDVMSDIIPLLGGMPFYDDALTDPLQAAVACMASVDPTIDVPNPAEPPAGSFEYCQDLMEDALADIVSFVKFLYESDYQVPFYKAVAGANVTTYGFDAQEYTAHALDYNQIEAIAKEPYSVAWKSVPTNQKDRVNALRADEVDFTSNFYFNDAQETDIPNSVTIPISPETYPAPIVPSPAIDSKHAQIEITGQSNDKAIQEIFAIQPPAECIDHDHDEENGADDAHLHIAGKLNVISYDPKTVKVQLVKVNSNDLPALPSYADVEKELDKVYQQAVMDVVLTGDYLTMDGVTLPTPLFPDLPSGWLSAYNSDMNAVINEFRDTDVEIDNDTYYIFLLPSTFAKTGVRGFMPRKRNFGFVFINESNTLIQGGSLATDDFYKTVAHELGHGAFRLKHTWEEQTNDEVGEGKTDNLMDYGATGTHLRKYQWDLVQDPESVITLFDGDEDGQQTTVNVNQLPDSYKNKFDPIPDPDNPSGPLIAHPAEGTYTFIAPSGKPITLPSDVTSVTFNTGDEIGEKMGVECFEGFEVLPFGTLRHFKIGTIDYTLQLNNCIEANFLHYTQNANPLTGIYYDEFSHEFPMTSHTAIVGYPCYSDGKIIFNMGQISLNPPPNLAISGIDGSNIFSETHTGEGDRQAYDFLIGAIIENKAQVESTPFPPYSVEASAFLEGVKDYADCFSQSSLYTFVHAHQISDYPGFYRKSCIGSEDFFKTLPEIQKRYRDIANDGIAFGFSIIFNSDYPSDFCSVSEIDFWKQQNISIYKAYKTALDSDWPTFWANYDPEGDIYNQSIQLFDLYKKWQNNSCIFEELTLEQRIASLDLLSNLSITGSNWWGNWISGYDEDNLYNAIIKTTPNYHYNDILDFFEKPGGPDNKPYYYYYKVIEKMDDTFSSSDTRGYNQFVATLTEMILTNRLDKTTVDEQVLSTDIDEYHWEYLDNSKIKLWTEDDDGEPLEILPQTELFPFEYVNVKFTTASGYTLPNGKRFEANQEIALPICYLDWLFRSYENESFELTTRIALDVATIVIGLATAPAGGLGLIILIADITYSTLDIVVAHDAYNLHVTGESVLGKKAHGIWDITGLAIGIPDLAQMVYNTPQGTKVFLGKSKNYAMHVRANETVDVARAETKKLINYLKEVKDNIPSPNIAAHRHIDGEIKGLQTLNTFSDDVLDLTLNLPVGNVPMTGNLKYLNLIKDKVFEIIPATGNLPKIKPIGSPDWPNYNDGWIPNVGSTDTYSFTSTLDGIHYTESVTGAEKYGKVDVYWDGAQSRYLFKVADVYGGLSAEFPDFFSLFLNKGWDFAANFTTDFANANIKNLSDAQKSALVTEMYKWDNITDFTEFKNYVVSHNSFDNQGNFLGNTKFNFLQVNLPENLPAWKVFNDKASDLVDDIAAMERMAEDLDKYADFSTFVKADNNLDKWKVLNKISSSDNVNFHLTEWFESLWFKGDVVVTPPTNTKVLVKHDGQNIAEVGDDAIDLQSFDDVGAGPFVGDDIVAVSEDGAHAIIKNPSTGKRACRGGACFPAGTSVHLPSGEIEPIENVTKGQMVVAWDNVKQDTVHAKVLNVVSKTWYRLCRVVAGQDTILATDNHPFYIPKLQRYIAADSLKAGMKLLALTGALMVINEVEAFDTTVQVYNFEVEEVHNYFVGDEGVLVHNDCINKEWIEDRLGRSLNEPAEWRRTYLDGDSEYDYYISAEDLDGNEFDIYYSHLGFPDFNEHSLPSEYWFPNANGNHSNDFKLANEFLLDEEFSDIAIPNDDIYSSWFLRLEGDDWVKYTWHHHEDGYTMIPVRQEIHNNCPHTGGVAISNAGLAGELPSP